MYKSCTCNLDSTFYFFAQFVIAVNPCATNNGGCSYLCLLSTASGGHTCVCPDGQAHGDCIGAGCTCVQVVHVCVCVCVCSTIRQNTPFTCSDSYTIPPRSKLPWCFKLKKPSHKHTHSSPKTTSKCKSH